jgi:hypothetical protein
MSVLFPILTSILNVGVLMAPAVATYEPRDPSRTVLYQVIGFIQHAAYLCCQADGQIRFTNVTEVLWSQELGMVIALIDDQGLFRGLALIEKRPRHRFPEHQAVFMRQFEQLGAVAL